MGVWLAVAKRIRKEISLILSGGLTRVTGKYGFKLDAGFENVLSGFHANVLPIEKRVII